jgi:hypothetical protein
MRTSFDGKAEIGIKRFLYATDTTLQQYLIGPMLFLLCDPEYAQGIYKLQDPKALPGHNYTTSLPFRYG